MKRCHSTEIDQNTVEMPGAEGCKVRWLIGTSDGAPNFSMRQFEVEKGGYTPKHSHPYEHEVYVLEGIGTVLEGDTEHEIKSGDVLFVRPDEVHQFKNAGDMPLRFLCLIPNSALDKPVTLAPECGVETE
jgi:quercetin dioxygenase-like cupin family protein